jgi:hypothetical protein
MEEKHRASKLCPDLASKSCHHRAWKDEKKNSKEEKIAQPSTGRLLLFPNLQQKKNSHNAETTVLATPYHAMTIRLPNNQQ